MKIIKTNIPDVLIIETDVFGDHRGYFTGGFYRVPADNRGLNYDKYFKDGDAERNTLTEFNSNNTRLLNKEEIKEKMMELAYIQERLAED